MTATTTPTSPAPASTPPDGLPAYRLLTGPDDASLWAMTVGSITAGTNQINSFTSIQSITDGTTNTFLVGEKHVPQTGLRRSLAGLAAVLQRGAVVCRNL